MDRLTQQIELTCEIFRLNEEQRNALLLLVALAVSVGREAREERRAAA